MLFWCLASCELNEAIELYATRAEAELALIEVLVDEPAWNDLLFVTRIELAGPETSASLN